MATGRGAAAARDRAVEKGGTMAGRGMHVVLTTLRPGITWSPRQEFDKLAGGKLGTGVGKKPIGRCAAAMVHGANGEQSR
jgi:hypothetical protein